jgi:hypothetical protein
MPTMCTYCETLIDLVTLFSHFSKSLNNPVFTPIVNVQTLLFRKWHLTFWEFNLINIIPVPVLYSHCSCNPSWDLNGTRYCARTRYCYIDKLKSLIGAKPIKPPHPQLRHYIPNGADTSPLSQHNLTETTTSPLKGHCHEIFDPRFFSSNHTPGPLIHGLTPFRICLRIRRDNRHYSSFSGVNDTAQRHRWNHFRSVNDTAEIVLAVSMTPLKSFPRCHWYRWNFRPDPHSCFRGVNDTAETVSAVSITPLKPKNDFASP